LGFWPWTAMAAVAREFDVILGIGLETAAQYTVSQKTQAKLFLL